MVHPLVAQERIPVFLKMGSMAESDSATRNLAYYPINGPDELKQLQTDLSDGPSYIVVKRLSFMEGVKVVHNLQRKIAAYQELDSAYQTLQDIEKRRHAVYDTLIKEEHKRVELYRGANEELKTQIDSLNVQFESASEVSSQAIKGQTGSNIKMGIVGGVIGLASGIVVGLIGTN